MSSEGSGSVCTACGKEATGNFCQHCGAALGGRFCTACGEPLAEGSRFCNQCGTAVGAVAPEGSGAASSAGARTRPESGAIPTGVGPGSPRTGTGAAAHRMSRGGASAPSAAASTLPWWIAGAAFLVMIVVVGVSMVRSGTAGPQPQGVAPGQGAPVSGAAPDISQMTPREAADRLFNRIQTSMAQGDTAGGMAFQPMGVQAYQRAEPLDDDGIFHMALLEIFRDPAAALSTIQRTLEHDPNHVLALGVAAQATDALGRTDDAAGYFQRLVDGYATEVVRPLPEYEGHPALLDAYHRDAQAYLAGR